MNRQRPGLVGRIRQMQRAAAPNAPAPPDTGPDPAQDEVAQLRSRVAHLEQLVQGLQDSVYRESQRHDKRLDDIEKRLDPATLAAELSRDARERGL
jgi:hypothetical protein